MATHIVLLGDSIFDNQVYVGDDPDVVSQIREYLAPGDRATLCAVDGHQALDVRDQLDGLPADATDLVLSVGGNDALANADLLALPVASTAEALRHFGRRLHTFETDYASAVDAVLARGLHTVVCTIYYGRLAPPEGPLARIALELFNDVIIRAAMSRYLEVIDLRTICSEDADYANPIEPSSVGGQKIACAIHEVVFNRKQPDPPSGRCTLQEARIYSPGPDFPAPGRAPLPQHR